MKGKFVASARHLGRSIWKNRACYSLMLPGIIWFILFAYGPMSGLLLAFKTYSARGGIWGSPWCGFENFAYVFKDAAFFRSVWTTLTINVGRLLFQFPVPIILALLINECKWKRFNKIAQTIFTFPYFLSWVIVASIVTNVAKTQENVPAAAMAEEQLGGTYFLYRPVFSLNRPSERLSYHALIYLRKDWMEACGLELKDTYTPDELEEIAKTFLEKDPGNVGDNLVGMSIRPYDMVKLYPTTTFSEACNIGDGYYKDENGQFQWAPADTRTLDALKKYQDLYQEGILDSEFYSYTRYQGAQKFYVQGTSGLTLEDGHAIMITYIRNGLAEQGLDPDKVLHLAQLVGDDGMYHYREDSNYWGQVMFSPTISQEKFERAMDILDYTCTEEGQNFMNMGFEGIDWKLDENGNYVSLLDPSIQGSATSVLGGKYPSKESSFGGLILPDDFSLVSPNYSHEIQDTVRGFYKLREELSDTTTLLPREYEYEFLSSREKSQATMDLGDEYAKLILKDGELEDNWNTWVEEKMAVVQPVLDQLNK